MKLKSERKGRGMRTDRLSLWDPNRHSPDKYYHKGCTNEFCYQVTDTVGHRLISCGYHNDFILSKNQIEMETKQVRI